MNRNSAGLYALDSLVSFPFLRINSTEGLYAGTLYDVLQNNPAATGLASVNATGFNISCGYLSITPVGSDTQCPCFYFGGIEYSIGGTSPIVITPFSTTELLQFVAEPLIFYSSIPIQVLSQRTSFILSTPTAAPLFFPCTVPIQPVRGPIWRLSWKNAASDFCRECR
ncbi:hypothetical protein K438DRAFT_578554 [Mycena galopus ATCC 62051]|nr:hypothetical protein K438DRAFT_578554 [Mycena galopus ATCC 62051]